MDFGGKKFLPQTLHNRPRSNMEDALIREDALREDALREDAL